MIKLEDNDYKTRRLEDNDGDEPPMWDNRISNKRGNKTRRLEDNDGDKPPMWKMRSQTRKVTKLED